MSSAEKANEYAIEALKQIMTLAGAVLALTITFLKDVLGDSREHAVWVWLVPAGWVSLIFSIVLAWVAIVDAADKLGGAATATYVFKSDRAGVGGTPRVIRALSTVGAWFIPFIPTRQKNVRRKAAASAQHYFVLGLLFLSLFAVLNLKITFIKSTPASVTPTQTQPNPNAAGQQKEQGSTSASP
jgi:hypothetical protein